MKTLFFYLVTVCFILNIEVCKAQSNCDELKKENAYLKKALQITTPVKTVTSSKIDFNLLQCRGNIKEQTVEFVLTLVNHDANEEFQFHSATAIDLEGNEYRYGNISLGGAETRNTIRTDVPIKTVIVFRKVLPSVKMLKDVAISYFDDVPGHSTEIEFRDVNIEWK